MPAWPATPATLRHSTTPPWLRYLSTSACLHSGCFSLVLQVSFIPLKWIPIRLHSCMSFVQCRTQIVKSKEVSTAIYLAIPVFSRGKETFELTQFPNQRIVHILSDLCRAYECTLRRGESCLCTSDCSPAVLCKMLFASQGGGRVVLASGCLVRWLVGWLVLNFGAFRLVNVPCEQYRACKACSPQYHVRRELSPQYLYRICRVDC